VAARSFVKQELACPTEKITMNRRELMCGLGAISVGVSIEGRSTVAMASGKGQSVAATQLEPEALPSAVAGVRLVDSEIARLATEVSRKQSPPYLFNHAVRTFLFGSLMGRATGQKFDEEVLYLACILHDLGLTERFEGDQPFEIQGAEAAKHFLEEHAYAKEKIGLVWDGIAMHVSPIGHFKQPEIALVGAGAGADVIQPDFSRIKKSDVTEIVEKFPRLQFKDAFLKTCAGVVRRHPQAASTSFMRDVRQRYVPEFNPGNFCDRVEKAPFSE
jgi:HD domain